jgi:hypothetical protein
MKFIIDANRVNTINNHMCAASIHSTLTQITPFNAHRKKWLLEAGGKKYTIVVKLVSCIK